MVQKTFIFPDSLIPNIECNFLYDETDKRKVIPIKLTFYLNGVIRYHDMLISRELLETDFDKIAPEIIKDIIGIHIRMLQLPTLSNLKIHNDGNPEKTNP